MILPRICVVCGLPTKTTKLDLCQYCITFLPWHKDRCYQCGGALETAAIKCNACRDFPPPYERLCAVFNYKRPLTKMIYRLKFGSKLGYATLLGSLLATHLRDQYKNQSLPQSIIPVPLHQRRLRKRGYNQAAELAKIVARHLNINLELNSCQRVRNTKMQARLAKAQRQTNLKDAFVSTTSAKHVAIIDDVVTTGSTVRAVCHALRVAGVEQIDVWCVCRG